jgi:hypothetical protein
MVEAVGKIVFRVWVNCCTPQADVWAIALQGIACGCKKEKEGKKWKVRTSRPEENNIVAIALLGGIRCTIDSSSACDDKATLSSCARYLVLEREPFTSSAPIS